MPSLFNTNAGPASNITWAAAARRVARAVGGASDPPTCQDAKECISEILQEWSTEKEWRFLQITAPPIAVTDGNSRYALPANYNKTYDAYLTNARVKLDYIEQWLYDSILPGLTTHTTPSGYSLFNTGTTGEVELFPTPGGDDTLVVRYYRLLRDTGEDNDELDIPSQYLPALLAGARAMLCANKGDSVLSYWEAKYMRRLQRIKAHDDRMPDADLTFIPQYFAQNRIPNITVVTSI